MIDTERATVRAWWEGSTEDYRALLILPDGPGPVVTASAIDDLGEGIERALRDYEYRGETPRYCWLGTLDRPSVPSIRLAPVIGAQPT